MRSLPCARLLHLRFISAARDANIGEAFIIWASVRNTGSAPVVFDGVSPGWLHAQSQTLRATAVLDGGDPRTAAARLDRAPFQPVLLGAGDERLVGLDAVPVAWHRLVAEHEVLIPLARGVMVLAPTKADCGR